MLEFSYTQINFQIISNLFTLKIFLFVTGMASNASTYTGEARQKEYINVYSEEFHNDGRNSFRVAVTLIDRVPHIGISRFWYSFQDKEWYPSKSHVFFKENVWKIFTAFMLNNAVDMKQLGLSGMSFSPLHNLLDFYFKE